MSITSKDIAAQRAMLARGDEKQLRDTFATAALAGIISRPQWMPDECVPEAYRIADAMLRERNSAVEGCETVQCNASVGVAEMDSATDRKSAATPGACARSCSQPFDSAPTTHDAKPEAKAANDGGTPKDADGTGNTPNDASPEAGRPSVGAEDERVRASVQSTGNTQEPVAWAILHLDQQYVSLLREMAEAHNVFAAPIVPLYRSPTLTAEEREALSLAYSRLTANSKYDKVTKTLRNLLERTK